MARFPPWQPCPNCNIIQYISRNIYEASLTFAALRDSAPLAGLSRAAALSSESSSLSSITSFFLLDFFDLDSALSDRATATPFAEVVRDFMVALLTDREDLEPADLLVRAFLLLDWSSLCDVVKSSEDD